MAVLGGVSGAPGMRPNLNKVVYYQYLIEMLFWKSGPESGPREWTQKGRPSGRPSFFDSVSKIRNGVEASIQAQSVLMNQHSHALHDPLHSSSHRQSD